jgi:hypothetical protein
LRSLSWRTRAVYVKHQAHLTWQEKRHDSSINTMFWNLGQHNCYEIYRPGHQYTNTILQINITSQSRVTVPRKYDQIMKYYKSSCWNEWTRLIRLTLEK